jgi:3',5'-cyclic-AMP phosphodiesterase
MTIPCASRINRRQMLKATALAAGVSLAAPQFVAKNAAPGTKSRRFAFLTDMHVQPEKRAGEGYAQALNSLSRLQPAPEFVVTGGDHVMDVMETGASRSRTQWDLYQRVLEENCQWPVYPVIGNHDVWGWGVPDKVSPSEEGYGKAQALDRLQLSSRFYSFDRDGWHFIALDNIAPRGRSYYGDLDPEQMEWLREDLRRTGKQTPVCIFSHIPLLSAAVFLDGDRLGHDHLHVPDSWVHRDLRPLLEVFRLGNIRLAVSGHLHQVEQILYHGTWYICGGAVCGSWWDGAYLGFREGYLIFDLSPDGSFECHYHQFGWTI